MRQAQQLLLGRPCENCGKDLEKKHGESRGHFNGRRFCGNACVAAARGSKPVAPKTCKSCGALLEMRPDEKASNFRKRVNCTEACRKKAVLRGIQARQANRSVQNAVSREGSFPSAKDRGEEKRLYGSLEYPDDATAIADTGSRWMPSRSIAFVHTMSSAALACR